MVFLGLFGMGIERTTDVVDLESPFITVVRAASLGLGTGYYLGASLKGGDKSHQWVLLGAFFTLTVWGGVTLQRQLLQWIPVWSLIVIGGILSIFAHLTPAIQDSENYKSTFKFLSGILTTAIVVFLGIFEFLLTLLQRFWSWFTSLTQEIYVGIAVVIIIGSAAFVAGIIASSGGNER